MSTTLTAAFPTLVDLARKSNPDGSIAQTVEVLAKKNPFLTDLAFKEGNLVTGHKFSARVALPSPTWRKMNQGIAASKAQNDTMEESCGMLEGLSKVDCALAELNGNAAAFRADEDNAFVTSYGLSVGSALFYSSTASNPEQIHGLSPRFDGTGPAAGQLIRADAGAAGADQTSIWLVGWSPDTVYGIYPKGSEVGLKSEDMGKQLVKDSGGVNEYPAYVTHHKWNLGFAVQDWRYVARIGNIDTSAWKADLTAGADLAASMVDASQAVYDLGSCSPVYYMNRATFSMLNKQLFKKSANFLEFIERGGRLVPHYLGLPVRVTDMLTSTEAVL